MQLHFYFDVVCPFAYLAFTRVADLAREAGADLVYRPILLGGLLREVGSATRPMDHMSPNKARITQRDAYRRAELLGETVRYPMEHPRRTVDAMRLLVAAEPADVPKLANDLYRAYWVDGLDVASRDVLRPIAARYGLDADAVLADPAVRQGLFDNTAEAVARGAFGVPTFVVGDELFWGVDRMQQVRQALGLPPRSHVNGVERSPGSRSLVFFHDFSSPFSYLASTQVERVAREHDAELQWAPILLGGLFRSLGGPIVPLSTFAPVRQQYQLTDMRRWAAWWGVPFSFPSHFPLRTVGALRVALAEPAATAALYAAAWAEDRNIGDPEVLRRVLDDAGFDGAALVERTSDPAIKAKLRENTEWAERAGACGAPSLLVDGDLLFWGQDRLDQVGAALSGWRPASG